MKRRNQTILSRLPLSTAAQPQVQVFNLSDALAEFRAQLEHDAGVPLQEIETNAACVLNDLCVFLGFGDALRAKVLGQQGVAGLERFLESAVSLRVKEVQ